MNQETSANNQTSTQVTQPALAPAGTPQITRSEGWTLAMKVFAAGSGVVIASILLIFTISIGGYTGVTPKWDRSVELTSDWAERELLRRADCQGDENKTGLTAEGKRCVKERVPAIEYRQVKAPQTGQ